MNKAEVLNAIGNQWLLPIMRGDTAEETLLTCEALIAGGARVIEVAFTTPDVCTVIKTLKKRHGENVILSAGTVRSSKQAERAIAAGADVIVAPNLCAAVVEIAMAHGKLSMPGCVTPTEIEDALRMGADLIKLFPCYSLGPEYVSYINAPLPEAKLVPAGSVNLQNMKAYYEHGAFAGVVGVTTEMSLTKEVKLGEWKRISEVVSKWLRRSAEIRERG